MPSFFRFSRRHLLIFLFFISISISAFAQQASVKLMAEVPIQFGIGYEGKISKRFSVALSAGVLTPPNSTLIVDILKQLGTDDDITLMIENSFKLGIVGKAGINYNFRRWYTGAFFEVIGLHAGAVSSSVIERHYGTTITSFPVKGKNTTDKSLTLNSTLYQAGVVIGRRFPFRNKRLEIDTEFSFSANLGSQSMLHSNSRNLSTLSSDVNTELSSYYHEYAYVPSLMVALVYHLHK